MQKTKMNIVWYGAVASNPTYMVTLSHAATLTIQRYSSGTLGMEKRRYSSTAVRFPLLYYPNLLIVNPFSLHAGADCVRPCARTPACKAAPGPFTASSITQMHLGGSFYPNQVALEFPRFDPIFEVGSHIYH